MCLCFDAIDGSERYPVPCIKKGGLAVHQAIDHTYQGQVFFGRRWIVTHAYSGKLFAPRFQAKESAIEFAERILPLRRWYGPVSERPGSNKELWAEVRKIKDDIVLKEFRL